MMNFEVFPTDGDTSLTTCSLFVSTGVASLIGLLSFGGFALLAVSPDGMSPLKTEIKLKIWTQFCSLRNVTTYKLSFKG